MRPREGTYRAEAYDHIDRSLSQAHRKGYPHFDVRAGDIRVQLWRRINRTATVCAAMYALLEDGDIVLYEPPSGFGANLKIRYRLPRPSPADAVM